MKALHLSLVGSLVLVTCLASACSSDDDGGSNAGPLGPDGGSCTSCGDGGKTDGKTDGGSCASAITCADVVDACGDFDDGCGGKLHCEDDCPEEGTYFVGGDNASDDNPGTVSEPFATIQKAASVAVAGEVVRIRSGTYRETVVPSNSGSDGSPITFRPDGDADVIVSGADVVTSSWSSWKNDIQEATVSLPQTGYHDHPTDNTTLMANQVFVNGKMMIEARWPNVADSDDLFHPGDFRHWSGGSWSDTSVDDGNIPSIDGGWTGGTIWLNGWFITNTRTITAHNGAHIQWDGGVGDKFRRYYYLTGKLGALDAEKEWFYDGAKLYLWAPGGGAPQNVEYKKRNYAFDVSGKSFITIQGVSIFAAEILSDTGSTHLVIDGIHAKYINHSVTVPGPDLVYSHSYTTGIRLLGADSIIQNSVVEYASDQGIVLGGKTTARNNLIHHISYGGTYSCGIWPLRNGNDQKILYNTIHHTGRSGIDLTDNLAVEIGYNEIYDFGMLNTDLGGIYSARTAVLTGTRIHHNWVHDNKSPTDSDGIQTGIYFDQESGPFIVDHNVLWNNGIADFYNQLGVNGPSKLYNNTFATENGDHSYVTYANSPADIQRNNVYRDDIVLNWGQATGDVQSGLLENTDPEFLGSGVGGLAYRLKSGSPAIDQGIELPGFTDGFAGGKPDIGAYESGGEDWLAGYGSDPTAP